MRNTQRLRFGIMCRSTIFAEWQARCLEALLKSGCVEPALLIVDSRPPLPRSSLRSKLRTLLRLRVSFFSLYNRYFVQRRCLATQPVDLSAVLQQVPRVQCEVIRRGKFSEYFKEEDLRTIRQHDLDFILRFGFNIIRGEILTVPRYGVWSYHHGDEQKYRGAPPCFWEIYRRDPETGVMLQRLTERLDGGVVLKKGVFPTVHQSYPRNRDAAHYLGAAWPAQVCEDIREGRAGYLDGPPTNSAAPIYLLPTNRQMILFALKQMNRLIQRFSRFPPITQQTGAVRTDKL